jgi:Fe2+ or Zn2+ uptake regulation protein
VSTGYLLAFDRVGLVHVFDGAERRFRLCGPAPHTHLMCTVCGRVCEVPAGVAREWLEPARLAVDFVVDPMRSDLYGSCGRCQSHNVNTRPLGDSPCGRVDILIENGYQFI